MFQLPFASCFNIRRFANRFNESYTVRDEFSMKTVREVVFSGLRSDDGPAEPIRTHLSITLVSDGPASRWLNQQSSVLSVFESTKKHPAIAWLPFVPDFWRGNKECTWELHDPAKDPIHRHVASTRSRMRYHPSAVYLGTLAVLTRSNAVRSFGPIRVCLSET